MQKNINADLCLSRIGLGLIFCYCFAASLWGAYFAQIHVRLGFLPFPIFVGEILLFICLLIFLSVSKDAQLFDRRSMVLLGLYFGWVLLKALINYYYDGLLTCRNAALFYYPVFAVFAYCFYQQAQIPRKVLMSLALLAAGILFLKIIGGYHWWTYVILFAVAVCNTKSAKWRWLGWALLVAFFLLEKGYLYTSSRSHTLSVFGAVIFWVFYFGSLSVKRRNYALLSILFIGVLFYILGFFAFSNKNAVSSVTSSKGMINTYQEFESAYQVRQEGFVPRKLSVHLYNYKKFSDLFATSPSAVSQLAEAQNTRDLSAGIKRAGELAVEIQRSREQALEAQKARPQPAVVSSTASQLAEAQKTRELSAGIKRAVELAVEIKTSREQELEAQKARPQPAVVSSIVSQPAATASTASQLAEAQKTRELALEAQKAREMAIEIQRADDLTAEIQSIREIRRSKEQELEAQKARPQPAVVSSTASQPAATASAASQLAEAEKAGPILSSQIKGGGRSLEENEENIVFRFFIWRDMARELIKEPKAWLFGFSFGHPQRSRYLEVLNMGTGEWSRDGWVTPHNSFFHIIYRAGILGIFLIGALFFMMGRLIRDFFKMNSIEGGLLVGALVYWLVLSNFLVILELPYNAIVFWTLFGITWAYRDGLQKENRHAG